MKSNLLIRVYRTADFNEILGLFLENCPKYFDPSEQKDLIFYLENEIEQYYVIALNDEIIGAGGINFSQDKSSAIISWDFIKPEHHGKGYGQKLLAHRLTFVRAIQGVKSITVRTSQLTDKFYAKSGFIVIDQKKDYWAPGYDLVQMSMNI
jgi:ribosomal-protein-alanine N-acetyltransferase